LRRNHVRRAQTHRYQTSANRTRFAPSDGGAAGDEGLLIGASFLQTTYLGKQRRDPHLVMGIDLRM
jgi:hypothetical protein